MGKSVRKQFRHHLPAEQIHQRILSIAKEENRDSDPNDTIRFERSGEQYRLQGSYSGFSINGSLSITAETLTIDINLPLLARMFQGKVERYIEEQAKIVLGKTH